MQSTRDARPSRVRMIAGLVTATICVASAIPAAAATSPPFYMGGDISMLPFLEGRGASYRDAGQVRPLEQIMVNHGANLFRLRLFVNPSTNYDDPSNHGAIQNLSYTIALAQRLHATGAKFALDLHYSDTWADPGKQNTPSAWTGQSLDQLKTTVHDYTLSTLNSFRAAGVMPDMVQVGNETTNGMLWPQGQIVYNQGTAAENASWNNYGQLVNSAISAVRQAQLPGEHTDVLVTAAPGDTWYSASSGGLPRWFYDHFTTNAGVTDFDILGIDAYPSNTGSLTGLKNNLSDLATRYNKKILLMETNQPWKTSSATGSFPSTPAGQHDYVVSTRDAVKALPNNKGLGVVWWYPEAVPTPNTFVWQNGAIALFDDTGGDALPALDAFSTSPPAWNVDADGTWYSAINWTGGVPMFAGNAVGFGSAITAPRTIILNAPESVAIVSFDNANGYTIAGTNTLTLDAVTGNAAINVVSGSHTIATPVTLNDDFDVAVAPANATLTISGALSATGHSINKSGAGTVRFANVRAAALSITAGTVRILPNGAAAGTSKLTTLTLAGSSTPTATLDLVNNALIVDYAASGASPFNALLGQIGYAFDNGAQDRPGIKTSLGSAYSIGIAEASSLATIPPIFDSVDASAVLLRATHLGDANLDGTVDLTDFTYLARNFNGTGKRWMDGDFNYDGTVELTDFTFLASNFNQSMSSLIAGGGSPGVFVPEPTPALAALAITAISQHRPRRRTNIPEAA